MTDVISSQPSLVYVNGPVFLSRRVVPIMIARSGGSIVNTASAAGIGGGAAGAAYTISKHALVGLTRSTAYRYAPDGIRCNAMACGGVETSIVQSVDATKMDMAGAARYGAYRALIPAMLKPLEIAQLALFLASDEAKHVNGAIVPVDAGWTAA